MRLNREHELEALCQMVCSTSKHICPNDFASDLERCPKCRAAYILSNLSAERAIGRHMTTEVLRKEYKDFRISLGLTLREAIKILDIPSKHLSDIEVGPIEPLEVDYSTTINVICHHCHSRIKVHPVKNAMFASYLCKECRDT